MSTSNALTESGPASVAAELVLGDVCGVALPWPAFERGWRHGRLFVGPWNADRLIACLGEKLWMSFHSPDDEPDGSSSATTRPTAVAGFWPSGGFVELALCRNSDLEERPRYNLRAFAATPAALATLWQELQRELLAPASAEVAAGPRIGLLNTSYSSLEVQRVRISENQLIPRAEVDLYYGDGVGAWIEAWIKRLHERRYGLSILSGDPGTGKTTLLRSLAAWLSATHVFYFVPAARFGDVDAGELVTFWAGENKLSKLRKVLVLEDGESVLLRRGGDNRERVATLLNLTDGVMGDALGLQVICTLNSDLSDLDPALLRPGRLVAHREFRRLDPAAAARLAAHLGRPTPEAESSSLAEIFHPAETATIGPHPERTRRRLGFPAAPVTL